MSNFLQKLLFALPAAYLVSCFAPTSAFAAPAASPLTASEAVDAAQNINLDSAIVAPVAATPDTAKNVNIDAIGAASSSEAMINPQDWQYSALKDVLSKYNCNNELNGAAVSRDVFAQGLNTCLTKVEPVLAKNPSSVSAEEVEVLKRLTQEFRAELSNIDTRIDKIQESTALAQSSGSQFSTTTKLKGEVAIGLNGVLSGGAPGSNTTVGSRVRLLLESTFTGKDRLYTRLAAGNALGYGNFKNGASGAEGAATYFGGANGKADMSVQLDWLAYQFPLGNTSIYAAAFNGIHSDYVDTHNPYFQDFTGASGAISTLAEENPIYKVGGGTGIGVTIPVSTGTNTFVDSINLGYMAGQANNPSASTGFFGGRTAFLAQVNFKPSEKFNFGLAYVNAYHNDGAIYDFGSGGAIVGSSLTGTPFNNNGGYGSSNSYGLSAAYAASENLSLSGYITSTSATPFGGGRNADVLTYGVGAAFPNVGKPGNLLGLFVGQAPTVTNAPGFASSAYHIEGFYKYKLNDNLSITPGLIYLTNPNQVLNNSTGALVGTVRTTFTF